MPNSRARPVFCSPAPARRSSSACSSESAFCVRGRHPGLGQGDAFTLAFPDHGPFELGEGAADETFNIVNGDVFRWRWMWPKLAAHFGVEWEGYDQAPRPLEQAMKGREAQWRELALRHGLAEQRLDRMASWWHTDADLGRDIEVLADMGKSRAAGFTGYRRTLDAFISLFDRYRADQLIP